MRLLLRVCVLTFATLVPVLSVNAGELLLGASGKSPYQIVVPDDYPDEQIKDSVTRAADLVHKTFAAQSIELTTVLESRAVSDKPGLFIGNTRFAKKNGVSFEPAQGWTFTWKVVGKNIIIAGNDLPDPIPLAQRRAREIKFGGIPIPGTLKSVCEFVHRYGGARFLSPLDRDLVFLPTPVLFIPDDLNITKRTWASNVETARSSSLYAVANGLEPMPRALTNGGHYHHTVFDPKTDPKEHPEYYVLRAGRRQTDGRHFCFSNPQVRERIYKKLLQDCDEGYTLIELGQNDGFIPCECPECFNLYGIHPTQPPDAGRAYLNDEAWGEKIWIMHRDMALRLEKDRPGVKLFMCAYAVARNPPRTITSFPSNVVIQIMNPTPEIFEAWRKLTIPGGYGAYVYTWGNFHMAGYTPLRSLQELAQQVKLLTDNDARLIQINGRPVTYGIEGINIYAFMRMLNDPQGANMDALFDEYLEAAYQEAAAPMRSFFRKLHQRLLFMPDAERYSNELNHNPLLLFNTLYTPDFMDALDTNLTAAEQLAKNEGVKGRLASARMEFDYLKRIVNPISLYYSHLLKPSEASYTAVLDAVAQRNDWLQSLADADGRVRTGQPSFSSIALAALKINGRFLNVEPFNWNIEQRRKAGFALDNAQPKRAVIKRAHGTITLESAAWKDAPIYKLQASAKNKAPLQESTAFQALYDDANLYIRVEASLKADDMKFEARGRDPEIWLQECINLNLSPNADKSQYYYLNYEPVANSYTDAQHGFITDPLHPRFGWNDDTWNGAWTYQSVLDKQNNRWLSLVKVPFKTLGATSPKTGTQWMGNVGRVHFYEAKAKRESSVWTGELNISNTPGDGYFGEWIFE